MKINPWAMFGISIGATALGTFAMTYTANPAAPALAYCAAIAGALSSYAAGLFSKNPFSNGSNGTAGPPAAK